MIPAYSPDDEKLFRVHRFKRIFGDEFLLSNEEFSFVVEIQAEEKESMDGLVRQRFLANTIPTNRIQPVNSGIMKSKIGNSLLSERNWRESSISFAIAFIHNEWVAAPREERPSVELAERIWDRLIAGIPPDGFTSQTFLFGMMDPEDDDLVQCQSLLAE